MAPGVIEQKVGRITRILSTRCPSQRAERQVMGIKVKYIHKITDFASSCQGQHFIGSSIRIMQAVSAQIIFLAWKKAESTILCPFYFQA